MTYKSFNRISMETQIVSPNCSSADLLSTKCTILSISFDAVGKKIDQVPKHNFNCIIFIFIVMQSYVSWI